MKSFKNSTKKLMMLFLGVVLINGSYFIGMESNLDSNIIESNLNIQNGTFHIQGLQFHLYTTDLAQEEADCVVVALENNYSKESIDNFLLTKYLTKGYNDILSFNIEKYNLYNNYYRIYKLIEENKDCYDQDHLIKQDKNQMICDFFEINNLLKMAYSSNKLSNYNLFNDYFIDPQELKIKLNVIQQNYSFYNCNFYADLKKISRQESSDKKRTNRFIKCFKFFKQFKNKEFYNYLLIGLGHNRLNIAYLGLENLFDNIQEINSLFLEYKHEIIRDIFKIYNIFLNDQKLDRIQYKDFYLLRINSVINPIYKTDTWFKIKLHEIPKQYLSYEWALKQFSQEKLSEDGAKRLMEFHIYLRKNHPLEFEYILPKHDDDYDIQKAYEILTNIYNKGNFNINYKREVINNFFLMNNTLISEKNYKSMFNKYYTTTTNIDHYQLEDIISYKAINSDTLNRILSDCH